MRSPAAYAEYIGSPAGEAEFAIAAGMGSDSNWPGGKPPANLAAMLVLQRERRIERKAVNRLERDVLRAMARGKRLTKSHRQEACRLAEQAWQRGDNQLAGALAWLMEARDDMEGPVWAA